MYPGFNNTTVLPLLLIQPLETSEMLKDLTMGAEDTTRLWLRPAERNLTFSHRL